jgi:hypothetical protein
MNTLDFKKSYKKRWKQDLNQGRIPFDHFYTSILNFFNNIEQHMTADAIVEFCTFFGIPLNSQSPVTFYLKSAKTIEELVARIEFIFCCGLQTSMGSEKNKPIFSPQILAEHIQKAINGSGIGLRMVYHNDDQSITFYPESEKFIDDEVIDDVISFLDEKAAQHFVSALQNYRSPNNKNKVDALNDVRRTLEEFLRTKLNNSDGLDKNATELKKRMPTTTDEKVGNLRSLVSQYVTVVVSQLDKYFNPAAKHASPDTLSDDVAFVIYMAAVIMQYVERTIKSDK